MSSGTTASGGAPSQLTSTYITVLLAGALQCHIRTVLRPAYASRYATLMKAVDAHLIPLGFTLPQPERKVVGGYFVWLEIPAPLTADALSVRCREESVVIAPGGLFEVPGDEAVRFGGHMRLCFAWEEESKLAEGVRRVGIAARKMLNGHDDESEEGEFVLVQKGDNGLDRFQ